MVSIPSVGVVLNWINENNKSGLYPVHIRIKQNNFARYYCVPTRIKIRKDQWAGKEGAWIKPNHPFAFEINNKIKITMHSNIGSGHYRSLGTVDPFKM